MKQKTKAHRRSPPRPIMLHQNTAMLALQSLRLAWPHLAVGTIPFHPLLQKRSEKICQEIQKLAPNERKKLGEAIDRSVLKHLDHFHTGVERYRHYKFKRPKTKGKVVWRKDNARLIDYGATKRGAKAIFIIPSLVNRFYILDLLPQHSFVDFLKKSGFRPVVLDWDAPRGGGNREDFAYYLDLTLDAFDTAIWKTGCRAPVIAGYCMGGVFAIAAALARKKNHAGLMLIATPWDFSTTAMAQEHVDLYLQKILPPFAENGLVPVDVIQSMFYGIDPLLVVRKFIALGAKARDAKSMRHFVALEEWINDGVDVSYRVMAECLDAWYGQNSIGQNHWTIGKRVIDARRIEKPALIVIPDHDRIVPPESAAAIARHIGRATILNANTGHIGIMAGNYGRTQIWPEMARWLKTV